VVGIEPTANGLQIRFRLSIPSNPGLFRAEKQDRVSTEVYQNLPISIGVAVNGCCQKEPDESRSEVHREVWYLFHCQDPSI